MAGEQPNQAPQSAPSDVEKQFGIDQIQDQEKREIVKTYFEKTLTPEQRESLVHEKSKTELSKLKQEIQSLNERHATAEEFVQQIISTMQKNVLERDMTEGYLDVNGEEPSYVDYFLSLTGTSDNFCPPGMEKYKGKGFSMDWDDYQTGEYCVNKVKSVIRSVPANVKREIRHQFAKDFIVAYSAAIDSFDAPFENFDMGEVTDPEQKLIKEQPYVMSFNAWIAQKGMKLEDVTYQYSKLDTKAILDTKSRLETDKNSLSAFPKSQQEYYSQQLKNIEGFALNNPSQAQEQLGTLEKEMASYKTFLAFSENIKGLRDSYNEKKGKYSDFDTKFDGQINDLQKKYDDLTKQLEAEKDPQKRLVLMDNISNLTKARDEIDFNMTKASEDLEKKKEEAQKTADETAAANPENAEEEDKPGFLDSAVLGDSKLAKIVVDMAKNVPLIGGFILSAFLAPSTLKKLGINAPTGLGDFLKANGTPKTPEQLKETETKAKKLLKEQFKIEKVEELDALSKMEVKDFLKKKPDDFDQERYDKFVTALKKNGANDSTDKKVFEYVLSKIDDWKSS